MDNLIVTILFAFAAVGTALALLGVGWLLTGKNRIVRGACGMDPKKAQDKRCGSDDIQCELCRPEKKKEK